MSESRKITVAAGVSPAIGKWMICTREWIVPVRTSRPLVVAVGDKIHIERADFDDNSVDAHFGGLLRSTVALDELFEHTRLALPDEIRNELKECPRCNKVEVKPGQWMPKPPCFTPREGVTIVHQICPTCDEI